jgi:hypothetical protein
MMGKVILNEAEMQLEFVRLSTVDPELVSEIRAQKPHAQAEISASVGVWIVGEVGLDDPRITAGVSALQSRGATESAIIDGVKAVADELDDFAWDIQDQVDEGAKSQSDYVEAFARSRAATSLWYAFDTDPLVSALESVYEAQAACGPAVVRGVVHSVIGS